MNSFPKLRIRPVQIVQNAHDAVAVGEVQVMEVVRFGGGGKGEVIAGVGDARYSSRDAPPDPSELQRPPSEEHAQPKGKYVGDNVLNGVRVDSNDADWGRPLVMLLVDVLIEDWQVKQAVGVVEPGLLDHDAYAQLLQKCQRIWKGSI